MDVLQSLQDLGGPAITMAAVVGAGYAEMRTRLWNVDKRTKAHEENLKLVERVDERTKLMQEQLNRIEERIKS